ncbi:MAG: hypothetical protein QM569_04090 [Acidovorax sp.]|uniref:hypothetical protein n=1 Tax=Acidovorax sp. TaxID=1872122 RepID=UPI0039E21B20
MKNVAGNDMAFKSEAHKRWWFANHGGNKDHNGVRWGDRFIMPHSEYEKLRVRANSGFGAAMRRFGDDLRKKNNETRRSMRKNGYRMTAADRRWNFVVMVSQRAYGGAKKGYGDWKYNRHINIHQSRARALGRSRSRAAGLPNWYENHTHDSLSKGLDKWQSWNRVNYWERRLKARKQVL